MKPAYLGDSVYVEIERGMLRLYLDNGYGPKNEIFLEPEVMDTLIRYYDEAKAAT